MRLSRSLIVLYGLLLAGCSDGTGPGSEPPVECTESSTRVLAVGEHQVIDANQAGACVRLPAAGPAGAEYLYIPLATAGEEAPNGIAAPYQLSGGSPATAAPPALQSPMLSAFRRPLPPQAFHSMLRSRERAMASHASGVLFSQGQLATSAEPPPVVGDQRTFDVCSTSSCDDFEQTAATARSVGQRVAIFVDDGAPAGGYSDADLDDVRNLFDQFLYPIGVNAFGQESDIDGNGVVIVLLTQLVNALAPKCDSTGTVVIGYFFGADLLPRSPDNKGSNEAEIFYGLVPDPANPQCEITQPFARSQLPSAFIHEFQHMISFNQHALVRDGNGEDTWLNEGLSHFAEELGGRLVPDAECPNSFSCADEFIGGNLGNAFAYLASPDSFFLIEPGNSTGKLQERGANWLFIRWLVDHFASDTILGTDLTRRLVATTQVGSVNVATQTGVDFSTLVGEWQLTNYLDDFPGFSTPAVRLRYKSWNFRLAAESNGMAFPLVPDSTSAIDYQRTGVLRAGSGPHVRVVQAAGTGAVDLELTARTRFKGRPRGTTLPSRIEPRVALVRIR